MLRNPLHEGSDQCSILNAQFLSEKTSRNSAALSDKNWKFGIEHWSDRLCALSMCTYICSLFTDHLTFTLVQSSDLPLRAVPPIRSHKADKSVNDVQNCGPALSSSL